MKYLISFSRQTSPGMISWGSHVIERTTPLLSGDDLADESVVLRQEYGDGTLSIFNFQVLPDESEHPSKQTPYLYIISYVVEVPGGVGFNLFELNASRPIDSLKTLREAEELIRSNVMVSRVTILVCHPMASPSRILRQKMTN